MILHVIILAVSLGLERSQHGHHLHLIGGADLLQLLQVLDHVRSLFGGLVLGVVAVEVAEDGPLVIGQAVWTVLLAASCHNGQQCDQDSRRDFGYSHHPAVSIGGWPITIHIRYRQVSVRVYRFLRT
jgi:hypothetical protein